MIRSVTTRSGTDDSKWLSASFPSIAYSTVSPPERSKRPPTSRRSAAESSMTSTFETIRSGGTERPCRANENCRRLDDTNHSRENEKLPPNGRSMGATCVLTGLKNKSPATIAQSSTPNNERPSVCRCLRPLSIRHVKRWRARPTKWARRLKGTLQKVPVGRSPHVAGDLGQGRQQHPADHPQAFAVNRPAIGDLAKDFVPAEQAELGATSGGPARNSRRRRRRSGFACSALRPERQTANRETGRQSHADRENPGS